MSERNRSNPPGGSREPILVRTGRVWFDEPCLHEEASRPVETIYTPLGRSYRVDMVYLATPAVVLWEARAGAAYRCRGLAPPGMLSLLVPIRRASGSSYWRSPLAGSGLPCSMPGAVELVFAEGQAHFIVLIDLALLRRSLPADTFEALERAAATRLLPASAGSVERFAGWLNRVLQETQTHPRMLQFPEAVRSLEEDLVRQLADAVEGQPLQLVMGSRSNRNQGFDRALSYLWSRNPLEVTLPSLCKAAAMSQRTLERAFQEAFDMTARDYLKIRRLHAVRRRLLVARKGEVRVADVAYSHGFYELGRFAAVYARMFGERPSETLSRRFPEPRDFLIQPLTAF